ncbi:M3 family metallopeptidase [Waterburya agarophytonicola K14]|uniref:oligopeptidase A n=1 Tax=Waterburya agarophytonicola KI4 TaxID=2874699 RepID=A0A964BMU4_9CYAN|nr:M3 family metallopeptidase [Waterburya agarophytonicola]MCC0176283.1 M3 family metallopeptidase [Waterburya agarophytonicola KI4]
MTDAAITKNCLLIGKGLPPFNEIEAEQVVPAMTQLLKELSEEVTKLEKNVTSTWSGLVEPLTAIEERLGWSWGIVGHLMGVKNSSQLREAYEKMQPEVIKFYTKLSQSKPLYEAFKGIKDGAEWDKLETSQKRIVESSIKDFELSGVGLEGETKERFNQIQLESGELSTKFSNNVLDATKAFKLKLTDKKDVEGLPPSALGLMAQTAKAEGNEDATPENGPWVVTLDYPSYVPYMKYATNRELREKLYKAFVSRASDGEFDNRGNIDRILALRKETANILGFANFAELSLAKKMATDVDAVQNLQEDLRVASYDAAVQEFEELKSFAGQSDLKNWDTSYWAEKQREAKFDFNEEELRPYFSLPKVLDGLFGLANRIFDVTITAADGEAPIWHEDVRYFKIADETGNAIAFFYLDPYSRPAEKRGGAWMNDCIGRAKINLDGKTETRLPVAYLTCNQTPPVDDKPSLMTFNEVTTLFHEFGHGLQHMLTTIDYVGASGINNVEWDAVELPSQFMENWCYDRPTLFGMAKHYETGETLPEEYYQKLVAAKNYMSGSAMLRQLHFGMLDMELHSNYEPGGDETPNDVRNRLAETTTVIPPIPEDNFLCAFGHIFAGGYAAGYYSYKWAEVLSADAFAAFEEVGLEDEDAVKSVGKKFKDTVLSLGGSLHPMEVFKSFRGREPNTEPLLRHSGLVKTA